MKNSLLVVLCFSLFASVARAQEGAQAIVSIDLGQESSELSPLIFGQFIEHLGRAIDGGIYEETSSLSDENGFRTDVLEKVKGLDIPLLRYPGGTYTKIYHWEDGIGPKDERPRRPNLIWGGVEDNHFGTAEFINYCRTIGAEPFLVVNMATGTPEEAAHWVEYCNSTEDTYYANLRRAHGYEEPFNVKYWGLGNEESAEADAGRHQRVERYTEDTWQFVKLMKLQDSSLKLTMVGDARQTEWNWQVLEELHPVTDFLALHFYAVPADSSHTALLQSVYQYEDYIDTARQLLTNVPDTVTDFPRWYRFDPRPNPLRLAIDEWGIWDMKSDKGRGAYELEYPYNWSHALGTAAFLHIFQRNSDIIGLATWAQTVNVLAPIMTTEDGSYEQTVYTPLQAYRQYTEDRRVPTEVSANSLTASIPTVDGVASVSDDGNRVVLSLINTAPEVATTAQINFTGVSPEERLSLKEHVIYTAPSLTETNTMDMNIVEEQTGEVPSEPQQNYEIDVPAASINFLLFERTGN